MNRTRFYIGILSALLLFGSAGVASAQKIPGIKVGETAPPFELKNWDGKTVVLKDLLKKGPVALVFYRSADW